MTKFCSLLRSVHQSVAVAGCDAIHADTLRKSLTQIPAGFVTQVSILLDSDNSVRRKKNT